MKIALLDIPHVSVFYVDDTVTCISDGNPEATKYVITVNYTDQYTLIRTGGICTLPVKVEFDTEIRCNTSNNLGTGSATTLAVPRSGKHLFLLCFFDFFV